MTSGRVYVLHGRRDKIPQSNIRLLNDFIDSSHIPSVIAYLEGNEQTIEDGVRQLQKSANHLTIIPVLLFSATHVRWDIPRRTFDVLDPDVSITYVAPIGTTNSIYRWLFEHIAVASRQHPERTVLLVAHGTGHFPEPYQELQGIATRLQDDLGTHVIAANLIADPKIPDALANEQSPLIVQRLFLTDGRLSNRIKDKVLTIHPDSIFLDTLENSPVITEAINERLTSIGLA